MYIYNNYKQTVIQKVYLKSCYVNLCKRLHLANSDNYFLLQIQNTWSSISSLRLKKHDVTAFFNFASIAATKEHVLSYVQCKCDAICTGHRGVMMYLCEMYRFLRYDPLHNSTEVLLDNLSFANGVQLSRYDDFVLVAETARARIKKFVLTY